MLSCSWIQLVLYGHTIFFRDTKLKQQKLYIGKDLLQSFCIETALYLLHAPNEQATNVCTLSHMQKEKF